MADSPAPQRDEIDYTDLTALRAIAEAATEGEWVNEPDTMAGRVWVKTRRWYGGMDMEPMFQVRNEKEYEQRAKDALHVCTFDPPTVLALLDRLEAAEERLARIDGMLPRLDQVVEAAHRGWWRTYLGDRLDAFASDLRNALAGGVGRG